MSNYSEKLKDPKWQKKRLEVFKRDNWACRLCGDDETTLAVHHYMYEKGKDPWDYDLPNLVTLCETCHSFEYEYRKENEEKLLLALKKNRFMASDVDMVARGIENIAPVGLPMEVQSSAISWSLRDQETQNMIIEKYFEYLADRKK
ncbi:MAG: HNH endonuclease [Phycisphaerae bacterium]|jgi:hypothetical protein